jgi:WD40 repeat protein
MNTELHLANCEGHLDDILSVNWSSDGNKLISGDKSGILRIWDREGKSKGILKGHNKWITCTCWEPFHINTECRRILSGSKD